MLMKVSCTTCSQMLFNSTSGRVSCEAMNKHQFEFLARKLRSKEPAISAARLVLLHKVPPAEAAKSTGISIQSLSRSLKSFREMHTEILSLYGETSKDTP